jgi:excisionase family DNA binding protein
MSDCEKLPRLAYSPEEVAQMLGLTRQSVLKLIRNGRLRGVKLESRWLIPDKEIHRFLDVPAAQQPEPVDPDEPLT